MVATPSNQIQALSISAFGQARSTVEDAPLSAEELRKLHAFWRASNYLAVGMICLRENPLLREPIKPEQIKQRWLSDRDFDSMFTPDKLVIFNFHGYPWLIHRLTYRRTNHNNIHVRGYEEKGNRVGLVFGREPDAI